MPERIQENGPKKASADNEVNAVLPARVAAMRKRLLIIIMRFSPYLQQSIDPRNRGRIRGPARPKITHPPPIVG
jgi:hypothetical protein